MATLLFAENFFKEGKIERDKERKRERKKERKKESTKFKVHIYGFY